MKGRHGKIGKGGNRHVGREGIGKWVSKVSKGEGRGNMAYLILSFLPLPRFFFMLIWRFNTKIFAVSPSCFCLEAFISGVKGVSTLLLGVVRAGVGRR